MNKYKILYVGSKINYASLAAVSMLETEFLINNKLNLCQKYDMIPKKINGTFCCFHK